MKNSSIIAFLPCRKGSQRVKHKNVRTFAGNEGGLTQLKIKELMSCNEISKIIISTDDEEVITICENELKNSSKDYEIDRRPAHLATSETSTDDLIRYVGELIPEGDILWTHVTSPFISSSIYSNVVTLYQKLKEEKQIDSLVTVTKHQKFFWDKNGQAINYNRSIEKWPRTQTMEPIYELNSGIFLCDSSIYRKYSDRVGIKPHLFELDSIQAMDVDWEEDFELAEFLWRKKHTKI